MEKIFTIKNDILQISVKKTGAELCGIKLLADDKEYMWNANPDVWAGYAPVLFPIIGALKDDSYFLNDKKYSLPRHGFVRNNQLVELDSETGNSLTFKLQHNPGTIKQYPFPFEFRVTYTLSGNKINVDHEVKNLANNEMLFSLGGHPAFKCPINEGEKYSDYYLEFEQYETAHTYQIEVSGLIGGVTDLIFNSSKTLNLHYNLFDKGALVFKNLKSRSVSLNSRVSGKRIEMDFEGFPYFGIWAKPSANFVCLEPWLGIADSVDANQNFENKEGIVRLSANSNFKAGYSIRIF